MYSSRSPTPLKYPSGGPPNRPIRPARFGAVAGAPRPATTLAPVKRAGSVSLFFMAVLLLGVIGWETVFLTRHTVATPPRAATGPVTITFPSAGVKCPLDATWSPDGKQVAVLGAQKCAVTGDPKLGVLAIYDAATGRLARVAPLDASLIPAAMPAGIRGDATARSQVRLSYFQVLWAPNGQTVAIIFRAERDIPPANGQPATQTEYGVGVATVGVNDGQARVAARPVAGLPFAAFEPRDLALAVAAYRWDLAKGTLGRLTVDPALGYTWSGGALNPTGTLALPVATAYASARTTTGDAGAVATATTIPASGGPPGGSIGHPLGGRSFTVWQTATLVYTDGFPCGVNPPPASGSSSTPTGIFRIDLGTAAWSPDGRYLTYPVGAIGQLVGAATPPGYATAGQTPACDDEGHNAARLPPIPIHDAGLDAVAATLSPANLGATLYWSPDNARLAAIGGAETSGASAAVDVYETRSGHLLAHIDAHHLEPTGEPDLLGYAPVWSPDGTHLALLDRGTGKLFILGPAQLGIPAAS